MIPEVGSVWIVKVDSPLRARVEKGDRVKVCKVEPHLVHYKRVGDHRFMWLASPQTWGNNFSPEELKVEDSI